MLNVTEPTEQGQHWQPQRAATSLNLEPLSSLTPLDCVSAADILELIDSIENADEEAADGEPKREEKTVVHSTRWTLTDALMTLVPAPHFTRRVSTHDSEPQEVTSPDSPDLAPINRGPLPLIPPLPLVSSAPVSQLPQQ